VAEQDPGPSWVNKKKLSAGIQEIGDFHNVKKIKIYFPR
jgi:hypothetical protein